MTEAVEKYGIESLSKIVVASAKIGNVACKVANKAGLFALLKLQEPIEELIGTDFGKVKSEIADLSPEERQSLESLLSSTFSPPQQNVDVKLDDFIALAEKTVQVIEKGVKDGHEAYDSVLLLIAEWKGFLV